MGKSSGGSAPAGSTTVIQDIAEPFKGFATRSLQRAEDLQGLPSVPFTGIATAPPTPDELVGAQALRNRFLESDPLSAEALALQRTGADPITAASILERQSPFESLIAQEAYRRLDERTQRDLQNQRAREVAAGGMDRGRGAIEDSLIRQRAEDQERKIGLEAGQRAFTDASRLAQEDRTARGQAAQGLLSGLTQRQALGRRDIDDLLKVGAQFREKFVQPELNLERQQFGEFRGPASVQNPFGFEQFFSGIRSAAPTPLTTTTQQFAQTPSGLQQIGQIAGAGLGIANQFGAFHEGGVVEHARAGHSHAEQDPAVINQVIQVLQSQGHLVQGPQGRMEFMIRMQDDPSFKALYDDAMAGVLQGSGYVPPLEETETETVVEEEAAVSPSVDQNANVDMERVERIKSGAQGGIGDDLYQMFRRDDLEGTDMIPRDRAIARHLAKFPVVAEEEEFAASVSPPDMDEGFSVGMAEAKPVPGPNNPTGSDDFDLGFATGMNRIPEMVEGRAPFNELSEMVSGRAVSPEAPEAPRQYSDAEITGMLEFANTGRIGDGRIPKGLRSLSQIEMMEELKPIRQRARENSKERRDKERRERIANRRNFRRSSSPAEKSASFDFDFSDVKEFLGFKEGGIASFANGQEVEMFSDEETTFTGKPREQEDLGNKQAMQSMMIAANLDPENVQDVAKFMREGFGEYAKVPGYPSRGRKLIMAEKKAGAEGAERRAQNRLDDKQREGSGDIIPEPKASESGGGLGKQVERMMEMYEKSFQEKKTKGFPEKIPMSDAQRKEGIIGAIAAALMGIKSDPDTGRADFSGVGAATNKYMSGYMAGLEKRRKDVIAAEAASRAAMLEGAKASTGMFKDLSAGQKSVAEAELARFKIENPNIDIIKSSIGPIITQWASGLLTDEAKDAAIAEIINRDYTSGGVLNVAGTTTILTPDRLEAMKKQNR